MRLRLKHLITPVILVLTLSGSVLSATGLRPRAIPAKPKNVVVGRGYDRRHVEVKFVDGLNVVLSAQGLPVIHSAVSSTAAPNLMNDIASQGGRWKPMLPGDHDKLERLRQTAQQNLGREIADLNTYFLLTIPPGQSTESWIERLLALPIVESAAALPLPTDLPRAPASFIDLQGYLNGPDTGLSAHVAWGIPGGTGVTTTGDSIKVADLEFFWNIMHNDIQRPFILIPDGMTAYSPTPDDNHGTAVLGILHSQDNGFGTTGFVPSARSFAVPTGLDSAWQVGVAILNALDTLSEGDVMLIEHQMLGPNNEWLPIEWWPSWYEAVLVAVGNGIHVIEAAGNGEVDLDDPIYSTGNGGHHPFTPANNSGAIVVGAGAAPAAFGGSDVARSRLSLSNYGSRVDVQGWGEQVMTTGYGYYYLAEGKNYWYTKSFSGTSSAAAMVAGMVASLESIYRDVTGGQHLAPGDMRDIITATGQPQQDGIYPASQAIGPLPDLSAAVATLPLGCCRGTVGNVNCDPENSVDISDVSRLVDYLFDSFAPLCCPAEANCNGDAEGAIDIGDVVRLINSLFVTFEPLPYCSY